MSNVLTLENRLAGAPEQYLEPAEAPSLEASLQYCKALAESHYENFHVASRFLPSRLRPHFHAIYAYCRIADDLGDEVRDPQLALHLLDQWAVMLNEAYDAPERMRHPVFVALRRTIVECDMPREPFLNLLIAFRGDQTPMVYRSMSDLKNYAIYSANPVGRMVLYACGYHDGSLHELSDKLCTGLQLANLWQDVGQDLRERNRIYLPEDAMDRFGVTEEQLRGNALTPQYRAMLSELAAQTYALLKESAPIDHLVDAELASTLYLFRRGGMAILDSIAAENFNTLTRRPVISKYRKLRLLLEVIGMRMRARFTRQVAV